MAWARSASSCLAWGETQQPGVHGVRIPKPWKEECRDEGAHLIRAERLIPDEVMARARQLLPSLRGSLDLDPDSVDGQPTFEIRWMQDGEYTHEALAGVFRQTVEERIVPMVRSSPLMPRDGRLVLCQALLRHYADGQRRVHPAHFDGHALVTAVFEVGAAEAVFEGDGFYVQPGAHASSRRPVALGAGDVVAHSFDLLHGVEVTAGTRCSVILWFSDSVASCSESAQPWYEASAAAGDADAQYNHGKLLVRDHLTGTGSDLKRGQSLLAAAARQGHFMAQNDLGYMCYMGQGCAGGVRNLAEAERWYTMAAEQGFQKALLGLSTVCAARGQADEALAWLVRAAEQRVDPAVPFDLGVFLMEGTLSPRHIDIERGRAFIQVSADMGFAPAQAMMGRLGSANAHDAELQIMWTKRAAEQGNTEAAARLAQHYLQSGALGRLAKLGLNWCSRTHWLPRVVRSSKWRT